MEKKTTLRLWMIVTAGLGSGFLGLVGAATSLSARAALAVLGGALLGAALSFHGKLQRL